MKPRRISCSKPGWKCSASGLLAFAVTVTLLLGFTGRFEPREQRDTQSYRHFDWTSPRAALTHPRTLGYPLLLGAANLVGGEASVPVLQWVAHLMAVGILFVGLRCAGFRDVVALMATCPLLISRGVFDFVPQLTGDSLAISLAVAATGCLLALLAGRASMLAAIGYVLFTFLAYQVRPAYLFLVALGPLLAALLDVLVFRRAIRFAERWRKLALITLGAILPLLAFCALRWAVVGHFGLVAFGGYNIVGVAGQFLDSAMAEQMPEDLQPLAREILRRRALLPHVRASRDFSAMEAQYNDIVWHIAYPAAESLYGTDRIALNDALTRLSHAILRRTPTAYAGWLFGNAKHAVKEIALLLLLDPGFVLVVAGLLVVQFLRLLRGPVALHGNADQELSADVRFRESHVLLWTALAFAAAKISLVILVEPAIARYMTGAMVFLPGAAGGRIVDSR